MSKSIHTKRLVLRPFHSGDAVRVTELIGNLSVSRWLTHVPHPYTKDDALDYLERSSDTANVLAITLSGDLIGCVAMDKEFGYWLGEPFWGNGYASEATNAFVDRYFKAGNTTVKSGYMLENTASSAVLTKLGFTPTVIEEAHCVALSRAVTLQKMTLSADDWRARS